MSQKLHFEETPVEKPGYIQKETADSLDDTAAAVRSTAAQGIRAIDNLAEGTAVHLDHAADYVRNYRPFSGLRDAMRRNPPLTLCAGLVAGLCAGLLGKTECVRQRLTGGAPQRLKKPGTPGAGSSE